MFGYVNVYKPELKMKDFYKYKAYYCGLCKVLKDKYGRIGQMTLSYDMTFLVILLTSLYESNTKQEETRCIIHPVKKHDILVNEITDYVADMNIALMYYHLIDDWKDDKNLIGLAGAQLIRKKYKIIEKKYPRQCNQIKKSLNKLQELEKKGETDIDAVSGCFGRLMEEVFVYKEDYWEKSLRSLGFFLGKFIYLLDAYKDIDSDIKKGSYNPLKNRYKDKNFKEEILEMLNLMMSDAAGAFEKLPCVQDVEILRNILYEGVWIKFEDGKKEGNKK